MQSWRTVSLQRTMSLYLVSQYHCSFLPMEALKEQECMDPSQSLGWARPAVESSCTGKPRHFPGLRKSKVFSRAQESQGIFQGSGRAALLQLLDLVFVFPNLASVATADAAVKQWAAHTVGTQQNWEGRDVKHSTFVGFGCCFLFKEVIFQLIVMLDAMHCLGSHSQMSLMICSHRKRNCWC